VIEVHKCTLYPHTYHANIVYLLTFTPPVVECVFDDQLLLNPGFCFLVLALELNIRISEHILFPSGIY
jgi:hypothetical protein